MKRLKPRSSKKAAALLLLLMMILLACLSATVLGNGAKADVVQVDPKLCARVGVWIDPASGSRIQPEALFESVARRPAVLLGESHTNAEDHRWQLYTSAALRGLRSDMVLGFEMFPRSVQPALDRWVAGELQEKEFLEAARWDEVWGYDAKYYLPLFHFARQNQIPMVALNVERSLVARIGREGWDKLPKDERQGLSDPAPASEAYLRSLAEIYRQKGRMGEADSEPAQADLDEVLEQPDFQKFVAAQLTWDRAMAEALVAAGERHDGALVVGIMGRGHVVFGHGVVHQMNDLGVVDSAMLLPIGVDEGCGQIEPGVADAVFLVPEPQESIPGPLLGVRIESGKGGVRVAGVSEKSVAEQAGIQEGDIITVAAGQLTTRPAELIKVIRRQAPGTWLPLEVLRDEEPLEIVAKFPTESPGHDAE